MEMRISLWSFEIQLLITFIRNYGSFIRGDHYHGGHVER